jgi:tetratricopeptide (TPR) repeat protein
LEIFAVPSRTLIRSLHLILPQILTVHGPSSASGYRNRATAYGEKKDYKKAIEDITKAIGHDPKDPQWYFDCAILKAKRGDYDAAMIDAETALGLSGGVPDLHPEEAKITDELTFNCIRLIANLEREGAKRTR